MTLALIVAMANNGVIGYQQTLPWHLSADLKRFKQITMGSILIMGRKTYESIGRPLIGRTMVVLTHCQDYQAEFGIVFHSLESALAHYAESEQRLYVIGGAEIYAQTLELANSLYLTQIHRDFQGDTFFPNWDKTQWREINRETIVYDAQIDGAYSFSEWTRKIPL